MAKVIVERSRHGGDGGKSRPRKGWYKNTALEDRPTKEGMKRPYGWGKELNENLEPLKRYLRSHVGRSWNDVYSEISQNLRPTNAVQQHVRDHVRWEVELHARIVDGKVYDQPRWGETYPMRKGELYVHPETGILSEVKRTAR
jgi:hypothetical protein